MALKTGIASLVLGTLLFGSTAALAEDGSVRDWANQEASRRTNGGDNNNYRDDRRNDRHDDRRDNRYDDRNHGGGNGYVEVHVHGSACHHGPAPMPPPQARGRYELQTVNRYVDGRNDRVWVPEVCKERYTRRGHVTKCTGGFYENRWVPGHYEAVQEWVWVSYGNDGGWRNNRAHAASYYP
ncbi:hypothetical protein [Pyxidicoccus caerfyrddinensis]|uniref:hypothetical protein n=1 Tax=Pyxidicoccus caerfyrddinensis TaxID=2709663 RepID=UPI001F084ED7|nr:hypothetical protein [Pyxidicoccus caerfyrddinensis]